MHLDEIVGWIDQAFGDQAAEYLVAGSELEASALRSVTGGEVFQRFLRDEVNRQIIRDYLTNAVVLGVITEDGLASFASQINSEEGRATLALYMLMSSVEEARDLPPVQGEFEPLQPLNPNGTDAGKRSHIKLVP